MVAHACNPSIWEAETGGSGFAASLSYLVRPLQLSETLFQIKNKNGLEVWLGGRMPLGSIPGTTKKIFLKGSMDVYSSVIEQLSNMHKALGFTPSTTKK